MTAALLATLACPARAAVLFEDGFDGAAGPVDATKWTLHAVACQHPLSYSCGRDSNVFLDGQGNLVLRVQREPEDYLSGGPFSGAWLNTFTYGHWPAEGVKASFPVPFHVEARMKLGDGDGLWFTLWAMNVDYPESPGPYELDIAEERSTGQHATRAECYQHNWSDHTRYGCPGVDVSNMRANWHVFAADVYADHVAYSVDGTAVGSGFGVTGRYGLLLTMAVGRPGTWASGGGAPVSTDPGPWDTLLDYVTVTSL